MPTDGLYHPIPHRITNDVTRTYSDNNYDRVSIVLITNEAAENEIRINNRVINDRETTDDTSTDDTFTDNTSTDDTITDDTPTDISCHDCVQSCDCECDCDIECNCKFNECDCICECCAYEPELHPSKRSKKNTQDTCLIL